jgi:hypothetical protein
LFNEREGNMPNVKIVQGYGGSDYKRVIEYTPAEQMVIEARKRAELLNRQAEYHVQQILLTAGQEAWMKDRDEDGFGAGNTTTAQRAIEQAWENWHLCQRECPKVDEGEPEEVEPRYGQLSHTYFESDDVELFITGDVDFKQDAPRYFIKRFSVADAETVVVSEHGSLEDALVVLGGLLKK